MHPDREIQLSLIKRHVTSPWSLVLNSKSSLIFPVVGTALERSSENDHHL
jgi:hypothetical protein